MPTAYELMEAYRTWWRSSYSTSPNSQAVILAAAWAEHVLATYQAGAEPTAPSLLRRQPVSEALAQPVGEAS
jgi:hypothetical protein